MSTSSSSASLTVPSTPAFSSAARDFAFDMASRHCVTLHAAIGISGFLIGNLLRTGGNSAHVPALISAFDAAQLFAPTSEFLPLPTFPTISLCHVFELLSISLVVCSLRLPSSFPLPTFPTIPPCHVFELLSVSLVILGFRICYHLSA